MAVAPSDLFNAEKLGLVLQVAIVVLLLLVVARELPRKLTHRSVLRRRILSIFASKQRSAAAHQRAARKLSNAELHWAYLHPDHTASAKEVVAAELCSRGVSMDALSRWEPEPSDLTNPSLIPRRMSGEQYLAHGRKRLHLARVVRGLALAILLICFVALASTYARRYLPQLPSMTNYTVGVAVALMLFGALVLLAISILAYENVCARFLLLRPFGERSMTVPLRRLVTQSVGHFGVVYTLSDQNYKPNSATSYIRRQYMLLPFVLAILARDSIRVIQVSNEGDFLKLGQRLMRKIRPSAATVATGGQALNIRTSDEWWQFCIRLLMHTCELIVIDLSKVKEGTAWELHRLQALNLLGKCLFVVQEELRSNSQAIAEKHLGCPIAEVFTYGRDGVLKDSERFMAKLGAVIGARGQGPIFAPPGAGTAQNATSV